MAKSLSCRDAGMACDWHGCAETEEELLQMAAAHARKDHGMTDISPEMLAQAKAIIKTGPCPTGVH